MYDRFDLEEEIMNIWQTEDDLDAVVHRMMINPDPIPNKEIANLLISVSKIHDLRCQKLFDIFEKMVHDNVLSVKGLPLIIGVYLWMMMRSMIIQNQRMKMPCKVIFGPQIYKKYVGVFCDQNIS